MNNARYSIPPKELRHICEQARGDCLRLRKARIFLTGCTGFLGKWIVEALLWAGEELELDLRLFALTRSVAALREAIPHWAGHAALRLLEGDVLSWRPPAALGVTHMIHGANYCQTGQEDWALRHMETAVYGTRRMLDLAAAEGCKNVLLLSSGAVYGLRRQGGDPPYREQENGPQDYLREPNVYAVCKYFAEMQAAALGLQHGMRIPIARLFTFAGQHMPLHRRQALSSFLLDARQGKDIAVAGDGTAVRSYMHAADMVICLLALLLRGKHGTPYNVGSAEAVSIRTLAHKVAAASGGNMAVTVLGQPAPGNAPETYVPDVSALRALMGKPTGRDIDAILQDEELAGSTLEYVKETP